SRATRSASAIICAAAVSIACACWTSRSPESRQPPIAGWPRRHAVRDPARPDGRTYARAMIAALARLRVALGWVFGVLVIVLANPTSGSIAIGMSIAACGEALRVWAAGHLNKAREVTSSGPYRWLGHPLYVGSTIMGAGLAIACANVPVAVLIAVYLATTVTAAIKSEEAYLRRAFGEQYELYKQGVAAKRAS